MLLSVTQTVNQMSRMEWIMFTQYKFKSADLAFNIAYNDQFPIEAEWFGYFVKTRNFKFLSLRKTDYFAYENV